MWTPLVVSGVSGHEQDEKLYVHPDTRGEDVRLRWPANSRVGVRVSQWERSRWAEADNVPAQEHSGRQDG